VTLASQQQAGELLVKVLSRKNYERTVALDANHEHRIEGCAVMKSLKGYVITFSFRYTCTECLPDWVLSSEGKCYQPVAETDYEAQTNAKNCLYATEDECEACPVGLVRISLEDKFRATTVSEPSLE
jgi:hypothetical protein